MKAGLGVLTLINIALLLFGGTLAMMSPMMFDSGDDSKLLWTIFWCIWLLPVLAFVCVFLPWLLLWLKWSRAALVTSAAPLAYFAVLFAAIFILT
jgi:hypothetical protein